MTDRALRDLPLADLHAAAGARFGAFAGWTMPLTYPAGVMKEHLHTRERAGLFDVSHMRLILVTGSGAAELLRTACPLEPAALAERQSKYTFFLSEAAGILDDLIVTRLGPERFMIVANAGNADADEAHLRRLSQGHDVAISALDRAFLALQGPEAARILARAGIETDDLLFMQGREPRPDWFLSRTGYTGEDGFEIALPEPCARTLVAEILADGRAMWVGLAARDSLRLEAGLCLHGNDITPLDDPASAGLVWAIPREVRAEGRFLGRAALARILAEAPSRRRVGLKAAGRQPVRAGATLVDADGEPVGRVTSGGFGPSAGCPVAMGYVPAAIARTEARLYADVRGAKLPIDVHPLPFTPHRYRKG